jgi:hypothetical protein
LGRIFDKLLGTAPEPQRSIADVDWYIGLLQDALAFGGVGYPFVVKQTQVSQNEEEPGGFDGYSAALFKGNPVIFGLMEARRRLFCQARFVWQQVVDGGPSRTFGSSTLGLLENPWPNGFTSDLLSRMIQDVDLEGNAFIARTASDRLFRLRPDWTTILAASTRRTPRSAIPTSTSSAISTSPAAGATRTAPRAGSSSRRSRTSRRPPIPRRASAACRG